MVVVLRDARPHAPALATGSPQVEGLPSAVPVCGARSGAHNYRFSQIMLD